MTEPPLLPSRARYLRERAEHERKNGVVWHEDFSELVRGKLFDAIEQSTDQFEMLERYVESYLREHSHDNQNVQGISGALMQDWGYASTDQILDVLAATGMMLDRLQDEVIAEARSPEWFVENLVNVPTYDGTGYRRKANAIFVEFRIAWVFVDGQFIPRTGELMHTEVVAPLEAILTGKPEFASAERAYNEALSHLASGQPGAAITSASSTLQEVLRGMGAKGGDLNSLMNDAIYKGFLAKHDAKLNAAFKSIADWAVADRGSMGNAHWSSKGGQDDAWLAVHIVGALVLRLAAEGERGTTTTQ